MLAVRAVPQTMSFPPLDFSFSLTGVHNIFHSGGGEKLTTHTFRPPILGWERPDRQALSSDRSPTLGLCQIVAT